MNQQFLLRAGTLALLLGSVSSETLSAVETDVTKAAQKVSQWVAHRGASLERPECTVLSIERAIEVGATAAEIDIRTSADGHLFILHDTTLQRTTNGKGKASDLTLAELRKLDAGSWFSPAYKGARIPTLIECAEAARGKIALLLDLKEQGDAYDRQVAREIQQHGEPARTLIGVRSVAQARRFRELLPEAKQLALMPTVNDIEAFAEAGCEFLRLWPRWLAEGDGPVRRVRAAGKKLHLNGASGSLTESLELLVHGPDSMSSDDPRRQRATLDKIAKGKLPATPIEKLIRPVGEVRLVTGETGRGDRSFLNRDYELQEVPTELVGLPRLRFAGGSGGDVAFSFLKPTVVFAVFEYNETGAWSFNRKTSPEKHGWTRWRKNGYRGDSNKGAADVWHREFKTGHSLSGLPAWWLCLAVVDLETARGVKGFREGLVSNTPMQPLPYSHIAVAAKARSLNVPEFSTKDAFKKWQTSVRQRFVEQMLYPYSGKITVALMAEKQVGKIAQQQFEVRLGDDRLFHFFKLATAQNSKPRPAVVCFMGHGKVSQILHDEGSYQGACAMRFAKEGYVVYAMENIGMGPGKDTHLDLDRALRLEGRGWYSLLFAHQRIVLDLVFADPAVDKRQVNVAGVSTGGLLALTAAAMEPRVATASVQGIFGSMRVNFIRDRHSHCSCGAIPNLLPEFDLPELALLVAPRPLHISNGETDGFPSEEARRCVELITPQFVKAGGEKPAFSIPPGGHAFAYEPALEFFRKR